MYILFVCLFLYEINIEKKMNEQVFKNFRGKNLLSLNLETTIDEKFAY